MRDRNPNFKRLYGSVTIWLKGKRGKSSQIPFNYSKLISLKFDCFNYSN